jgi:hypothetical protein
MTLLDHALDYHRRGWCIIPIRAGSKAALCEWKPYQEQRPDEKQLRRWFGCDRGYGLAVVLGEVSGGLMCRDFDCMQAYSSWTGVHPELAARLPTARTHRGRHVYGRGDVAAVRAESPSGGGIITYNDGELRAGGCYCLVPPSRHPSGSQYEWEVPLTDEVPQIDVRTAGFLETDPCNREHRDDRDDRDDRVDRDHRGVQKSTEAIHCSVLSVLSVAGTENLAAAIEHAIAESLPTGPGVRHRQVFELARALKAIPMLQDAPGADLRPLVEQWHRLAKPVITTQPFEETWIDFLKAWPRVKFPKGAEPMAGIFARATENIPQMADQYEQLGMRRLITLCRELQRESGGNPFFLSCRTAGRLLDVDHSTANRWLFLVEAEGVLRVTARGGPETQKATRYRYLGD